MLINSLSDNLTIFMAVLLMAQFYAKISTLNFTYARSFTFAQHKFQVNNIPVWRNGNTMQNPWSGGLNNPIFSPMDINGDGLDGPVYL